MAQRREDMMGRTPEIGDSIVYNPPNYKGIYLRICKGFAKSGLPILVYKEVWEKYQNGEISQEEFDNLNGTTPKTGFVIIYP